MSETSPPVSLWRRSLAVLFSLTPGCGHVLLGRWRRGAVWLGALLLLQASLPLTGFPGLLLLLGTILGAVVEVRRLPPREGGVPAVGWVLLGLLCFWTVAGTVGSVARAALAEPFHVPSSSMQPTLFIGDQFYTDKTLGSPLRRRAVERGEVILFTPPPQPQVHFVMRAVALAGDTVAVRGGQLHVGGRPVATQGLGGCEGQGLELQGPEDSCRRYEEVLGEHRYQVLLLGEGAVRPPVDDFPSVEHGCPEGMEPRADGCVVPAGHVFVLGDNRSNAYDSRSWGPLPVENVVAAARFIHFSWTPESGVRWSRLGTQVR